MASFNFTVDTQPMAQELSSVSRHVDATSVAVTAMQVAVMHAEKDAAQHVCDNVNYGFYTLMHSQISQKIAQLTATVETKLIEMSQQAAALSGIKKRMERDYNMIANRYGKLTSALNASLQMQIYELDKPVVNLVHRDMQLNESRVKGSLAGTSTHQIESLKLSQQIVASKTKADSELALNHIRHYVENAAIQNRITKDVMRNRNIDAGVDVYLPIVVSLTSSPLNAEVVDYVTPQSGNRTVDKLVNSSIHEEMFRAVHDLEWTSRSEADLKAIEAEYTTCLTKWEASERVKQVALELFRHSSLQQLKKQEA